MLLLWPAAGVAAEQKAEKRVSSIEVTGNRYVEAAAIQANIETKVGQPLSKKMISQDVKRLFKTGYFEDVYVVGNPEESGVRLIYTVKENPLISTLTILGNDEIVDKDIKPKLSLKPGRVYSAATLRSDRNTIRKAYLKKGYYQVDVTAETVIEKDGRVALTLNVSEGEVTHIKRIRFINNSAFSDGELRDVLASQESGFISWFSDRDVFDKERFGGDAQLLQQHYLNNGYLDVAIESAQLSLTPDKKAFYLTFALHEGPQYTVSGIDIQGDLVPSREALMEAVELKEGEIYSVTDLRNSITAMEEKVGDEGYAFASVTPLLKRDVAQKQVAITFDIEKGREVYIERIQISGNEKTEDRVVRRELRQFEGARYSATNVKLSKDRLNRSKLYRDLRVNLEKGEADDQVQMNVNVEEDKTGSFSVGAGYSQLEKVTFAATLEERNFLGKGYTTKVGADVGSATQNFNVSLADPYFLDSDVGASLNLFKTQTKLGDIVDYKQDSMGGGVNFALPLSEHLTYSIGYQYNRTELTDIPVDASLILRAQEGLQTTGEVRQSLNWDTRDRAIAPSEGHQESLGVNIAGLGGSNKFAELAASTQSYFSLGKGFILSPALSASYIKGFAPSEIPIYRRYSLGGIGSLRGFDSYGVSIRDPATGDILGGDKKIQASLDLFFPMPYMETAGFRGVIFLDAGSTWGSVSTSVGALSLNVSEQFSTSTIRASTGLGVEWMSPVGPLSLVWGIPINKVAGDITRSFEFGLGVGF
ncbi:MAG: outer membrane protein assembly factor BamA [Mariprofundaceae bacterium]|nr:outer membrane protein assembly factor BamA [Mariprofundaceae bacterium]